ncbi:hypothetical protein [Defluviimonas sp. SAOS-178_SWC]|uniref:hypothetical protein n=1 Tax=Defluviimonas sp. SAOS-178_SWC TaxID=3121287 RepID=UPI0032221D72
MVKIIILASIAATAAAPVRAAESVTRPACLTGQNEVQRVDPGKTLKLIKRIKDAGGPRFAS